MQPVLCIATGRSCVRLLPLGQAGSEGGLWSAPWRGVEMLDGGRIHRVGVRSGARATIFAASWGEGLWFSRDGGRRWSNAGVDIQGSRVHCAAATSSGEFFVGSDHAILKRSGGDLRRWELLDNLWLVPSSSSWSSQNSTAVRDIAVNPRHEEWLLTALDGVGVLFSSDGGFSWDDARPNTDPQTLRLLWHPDEPTHALALAPNSLRQSDDGGWSWSSTDFPLTELKAVAALPEGQWLVAGQSGERSELWRGEGTEWLLAGRFPSRAPKQAQDSARASGQGAFVESVLVVSEEESAGAGAAWLAGWSDGALEVSLDSGRSWRPLLMDGAQPERACDMALSMAQEEEEDEGEEQAQKIEAARDARNGSRFNLDEKFQSSLLDKNRGRV